MIPAASELEVMAREHPSAWEIQKICMAIIQVSRDIHNFSHVQKAGPSTCPEDLATPNNYEMNTAGSIWLGAKTIATTHEVQKEYCDHVHGKRFRTGDLA